MSSLIDVKYFQMKIDISETSHNIFRVTKSGSNIKSGRQPEVVHIPSSVDIKSVSAKYITDVVLLVDREDFLEDITKLREKWGMSALIGLELPDTGMLKSLFLTYCKNKMDAKDDSAIISEILDDVKALRIKYGRTSNFDDTILWVLLTHSVPSGIFKACYFTTIPALDSKDPSAQLYSIILDGRVEESELLEAYADFKQHLATLENAQVLRNSSPDNTFQSLTGEIIRSTHKGPINPTSSRDRVRNRNNILLMRELYWKKKTEKITYYELADYANKKCDKHEIKRKGGCIYCNATYSSIKEGIREYKELLKVSL